MSFIVTDYVTYRELRVLSFIFISKKKSECTSSSRKQIQIAVCLTPGDKIAFVVDFVVHVFRLKTYLIHREIQF